MKDIAKFIDHEFRKLKGSNRGSIAKRNSLYSFVIMVLMNITQLALVPVVIGIVEPLRYGIWLTISSFLGWFTMLDVGLGGGFRNRLGEAIALGNMKLAKEYVSTAYVFISGVSLLLILSYLGVKNYISWSRLFNSPPEMEGELTKLMLYVTIFFVVKFVLQLINNIFTAFRKTALTSFINFGGSFLSLSLIYLMSRISELGLIQIGMIYSLSPVLVMFAASICFFCIYHRDIVPSVSCFRISYVKSMLSIGLLIIINQLAVIVINTSTNMLISHIADPSQVTPYSVSMRFFGFFITVFEVMMIPLMPAFTNAFATGDLNWIKTTINKARKLAVVTSIFVILSAPLIKLFIECWLKGKVVVSWELIMTLAIYVCLVVQTSVYSKLFNGTGKLRSVTYLTVFNIIIYIPVAFVLGSVMKLGVTGIVIAKTVIMIPAIILMPIFARNVLCDKQKELSGMII